MFSNNKRNSRATAAITTLIAEGTVITGDVKFSGGLHLDGSIQGGVTADGDDSVFTLSEKGTVKGEIRISNALINGRVEGDIIAAERLELAGSARVHGDVYYKVLEMAAGAQINGKMIYQTDTPRQLAAPVLEPALAEA